MIKSTLSTFKQSKTAHCLTLQGYKDQPTTFTQIIKTKEFWSLKPLINLGK